MPSDIDLEIKQGYHSLSCLHPQTGELCTVFLSIDKGRNIAKIGDWRVKELAYTVPATLIEYNHAFEWTRDETVRGYCLIGRPSTRFVGKYGTEAPPPPKKVFVVFVTERSILHEWRWEDAANEESDLPLDQSSDRFGERIK